MADKQRKIKGEIKMNVFAFVIFTLFIILLSNDDIFKH